VSQTADKVEKDVHASSASKLLVICVDRDNDVGDKTGITTPAVGRDACIEAAQRLALEDPEDADSNSIFAAIKTYEDLVSRGYEAQVITVAGVSRRGIEADQKIAREIKTALEKFAADGAVIVSDGEDDESVIPSVQNILPVISVQRVVMKVSRSVEYSYAVFGRYLKTIAYDSKYSKFFLGVPGVLLLIGGVASIVGYAAEITAVLISILGGAFIIRAFDIDTAWISSTKPTPTGVVRMFTLIAGAVLIIASMLAGAGQVEESLFTGGIGITEIITNPTVIGEFIAGALPILWVGVGTVFAGIMISNWFGDKGMQRNDLLRLIVLASLYPTIFQFTNVLLYGEDELSLVPPLLAGLCITLGSGIILFRRYRKIPAAD
jgi:putative membrane protein